MKDEERDDLLLELTTWEQDLKPLRAQWDLFWNRWELVPPSDTDNPYISKFQPPYPFSHVETILPRIVGTDPSISYVAIDEVEDEAKAKLLSAVVNWQLQLMRFEWEVRNFVRQALITGYSVAKVGWVRESRQMDVDMVETVWHDALETTFDVVKQGKAEIVERNQAFIETVDIYDFIWPVRATSLGNAEAVWQRCWVTKQHLQEMAAKGHYTNIGDVEAYDTSDRQNVMQERYAARGLQPSELTEAEYGEIELWERWTDDRLVVIANREHVIRDEPNPFHHGRKPFIDFAPVSRPFALDGVGIIKMMWDMNEDLGALKRQRRDAITYTINPMFKGTEGIQEADITIRPGGFFKVPDTEDIEPMVVPQIDYSASYQEEQNAKNDMQAVTGAFDYLSGVNPGGVQTATGVATISQEGNKRIGEMVSAFAERAIKPLGYQLASLCVQYLDNEVAVPLYHYPEAQDAWKQLKKVEAGRIVKIGKEDIETAGRVLPLPQVGVDKQTTDLQKRSDAVQLATILEPLAATGVINWQNFAAYVMKQMGVEMHDRAKILDVQAGAAQGLQMPMPNGQGVGLTPVRGGVGANGVAGPVGPPTG